MIENTRFGFIWNNLHIERMCDYGRKGVVIVLMTDKQQVEIRITPGGKIKIDEIEKTNKQD